MAEQVPAAQGADTAVITEAFATARELLARAEADAAEVRAAADRYVRQREAEAELLVGKARRLLAAAEARSSAIRRDPAPAHEARIDPSAEADVVIDLDALAAPSPAVAPGTAPPPASPARRTVRPVVPSATSDREDGFDGILASAVTRAVDRALAADA
ncbi:MAG: hypothetical protein Q8K72_10220 [Acidimicrobiales bacterium]|nr:hypothetical protein [Acidimicrobiales bacterium]